MSLVCDPDLKQDTPQDGDQLIVDLVCIPPLPRDVLLGTVDGAEDHRDGR